MKNFIKGICVGIFNIIPGLSGCALLVIFNLYDTCIEKISNILKNPKENFIFLFPIASGIIIGTYLFSNIIFMLLNKYQAQLYIIFTFFLLGTTPYLLKEAKKEGYNKKSIIIFIITFIIGTTIIFINNKSLTYNIDYNFISIIKALNIGIILSFSTIIPGISSTVLLNLTNLYGIYIYSISSFKLILLIPIGISFIITTFFLSKLINYLLKNYYSYTYFAVLGFSISTIPSMLKIQITFNNSTIISIFIGIIAFIITNYTFKVIK